MAERPFKACRSCGAIGLRAFDFGIHTCRFATDYCRNHCYMLKTYIQYGDYNLIDRDEKNTSLWEQTSAAQFAALIPRGIDRFRWATRGEACHSVASIRKLQRIAQLRPDVTFWLPTRAWHSTDPAIRAALDSLRAEPNMRVMASIDPSDSQESYDALKAHGWPTMYFGSDVHPFSEKPFMCPKTWKHVNASCATCKGGCFRDPSKATDVHLKEH